MGHKFSYLTDATHETLTDNVKRMVNGWGRCKTSIYNILDGSDDDPFCEFLSMYTGAIKGGVTTEHWDAELAFARERHGRQAMRTADVAETMSASMKSGHATIERYFDAVKDGTFTLEELTEIEKLLVDQAESLKEVQQALKFKRQQLQKTGGRK